MRITLLVIVLDDIFTNDNPEFAKHIPNIYLAEFQLNKANTSVKETFFLDVNTKMYVSICSIIHTSVYDKRHDFGFSIVSINFLWLNGDIHILSSYSIYFSLLVQFARC